MKNCDSVGRDKKQRERERMAYYTQTCRAGGNSFEGSGTFTPVA